MTNTDKNHSFLPGIKLWCASRDQLLDHLTKLIESNLSTMIITLNPVMVLKSREDEEIAEIINNADIVVTDGQGVKWACRKLTGKEVPLIPGVELAESLIEICSLNKWNVAFIGGKPGIWEKAAENLKAKYPGLIISTGHHGYFNPDEEKNVVQSVIKERPKLLLAGMGFPKQEKFLFKYREAFGNCILIGVGGSLDIYAGTVRRAPELFRKLKIEWLWRMFKEPSRFGSIFTLIKFWSLVQIRHNSLFNSSINDRIP